MRSAQTAWLSKRFVRNKHDLRGGAVPVPSQDLAEHGNVADLAARDRDLYGSCASIPSFQRKLDRLAARDITVDIYEGTDLASQADDVQNMIDKQRAIGDDVRL
jgi:hypothetical protein